MANRTSAGWETVNILPPRALARGRAWKDPGTTEDLGRVVSVNFADPAPVPTLWSLDPFTPPTQLASLDNARQAVYSDDLSLVMQTSTESLDPAHPTVPPPDQEGEGEGHLYQVNTVPPRLLDLLPDGSPPACGVNWGLQDPFLFPEEPWRRSHWISRDGSRVVFPSRGDALPCDGPVDLYVRDLVAGETRLVTQPISGPRCDAAFIGATPGGSDDPDPAVFYWTSSRLAPEDNEVACAEGINTLYGDVYRYDIQDGQNECLTCVDGTGGDAVLNPHPSQGGESIGISEDGARVYFASRRALVPGAVLTPESHLVYRLDVASGDIKYVAPIHAEGPAEWIGVDFESAAMNRDGSVLAFRSRHQGLNALTGSDNGGFTQAYRYDDRDGSLACISCPRQGAAIGPVGSEGAPSGWSLNSVAGHNSTPVSANGTVVFSTTNPLLPFDQNTPFPSEPSILGFDVYEWRDGRLMLITDGETSHPEVLVNPAVVGITPSGRDVFFRFARALTPDAKDDSPRLYTARIGGGIHFPPPQPPCPLEICQGNPKGAPDDPAPGTNSALGTGNVRERPPARCRQGKRRRANRCVSKRRSRCGKQSGRRARRCATGAKRKARQGKGHAAGAERFDGRAK
jgi:hypothetical protein